MAITADDPPVRRRPRMFGGRRPLPAHVTVYVFVIVPFLALLAAVPVVWGWGPAPRRPALARGFWHAHLGWILDRNLTDQQRFAPDLLADRDMRIVHRLFGPLTIVTLLGPAVMGGLLTWSWVGALTAFFWAGLVRIAFLHHVTWSVNSVCHMVGERPFTARDKATNFWPLALLSAGEAWHNLHHADPKQARHGVQRGQIDITARLIWLFEKAGWAYDVQWPTPERLARITRAA